MLMNVVILFLFGLMNRCPHDVIKSVDMVEVLLGRSEGIRSECFSPLISESLSCEIQQSWLFASLGTAPLGLSMALSPPFLLGTWYESKLGMHFTVSADVWSLFINTKCICWAAVMRLIILIFGLQLINSLKPSLSYKCRLLMWLGSVPDI